MTTVMYDSVDLSTIPNNPPAVAGYTSGWFVTDSAARQRWPNAKHVSIAINAAHDADAADCEPGDLAPSDVPGWFARQRPGELAKPVIYASLSTWRDDLLARMTGAGHARDSYFAWCAHYDYVEHICTMARCGFDADGTQWTDQALGRNLDQSLMSDAIFGGAIAAASTPAAPAWPTPPPSSAVAVLSPGRSLTSGQSIGASVFQLVMQTDGNLVAYQTIPRWSTNTNGHPGSSLVMQPDGNLVVYSANHVALWASGTNGHDGSRLVVQGDGNGVIYGRSGNPLWSTGTAETPGAATPVGVGVLAPGAVLAAGQCLPDGPYTFIAQGDGNVVLYQRCPRWASGTNHSPGSSAVMQADGNLVVYDSHGVAVWATSTSGHPGASLTLQGSDGNVVLYDDHHVPMWASAT